MVKHEATRNAEIAIEEVACSCLEVAAVIELAGVAARDRRQPAANVECEVMFLVLILRECGGSA